MKRKSLLSLKGKLAEISSKYIHSALMSFHTVQLNSVIVAFIVSTVQLYYISHDTILSMEEIAIFSIMIIQVLKLCSWYTDMLQLLWRFRHWLVVHCQIFLEGIIRCRETFSRLLQLCFENSPVTFCKQSQDLRDAELLKKMQEKVCRYLSKQVSEDEA